MYSADKCVHEVPAAVIPAAVNPVVSSAECTSGGAAAQIGGATTSIAIYLLLKTLSDDRAAAGCVDGHAFGVADQVADTGFADTLR